MTLEALIDGLSRDEQVIAMELLWKRLSRDPQGITPPEWHRDVVATRVQAVKDGTATLVDWKDAKKRLSDRLQ